MTDEETFDIEEASDLKEEEKKFKTKLSGNLEQKLAQHNENMFQVFRAIKKDPYDCGCGKLSFLFQ